MANQITDNRTPLFTAEATTNWTALSSTSPTLDTDIKIQSNGSIGEQCTNSRRTLIWDNGSTLNMSNTVFYVWVNCGIVGLLDTKANGGMRVRFTGASASNFFEINVGGSDEWPLAIAGGWVQFVVDIPKAQASPSATGGTPPAITAIQGFGISFVTASVMPKVGDNTWIDAGWTLADGTAGILVEGRNGGTTDWTWADVRTQLGQASGLLKAGPAGTLILNTSVQFGINDTSVHGFTDSNREILFDQQDTMETDHYFVRALGNSGGTTRVVMGTKTGTGDDATGALGCRFVAGDTDPNRCAWDFDDANLDDIGFYNCLFQHQGDFQLDQANVSAISCNFIDCTGATITDCRDFLRNKIIDANTADGVAFITTNDLADMVFNQFEFSDGHAVRLVTTPSKVTSQTDKGNTYSGYGATGSTDAEYYNDTGAGLVTISITNGGNGQDYRNGTSASTTVQNTVTLQVTVQTPAGAVIPYATVRVENASTGALITEGVANQNGVFTDSSYNYSGDVNVTNKARRSSPGADRYLGADSPATIISSGMTATVSLTLNTIAELIPNMGIMITGALSENAAGAAAQTVKVKVPSPVYGVSRKLVVGAVYWDSATNLTVTAMSYDGNAMTNIAGATTFEQEGAGNFHELQFYRYDIPDTDEGVKDVVITWSANVALRGLMFALLEDVATGAVDASTTSNGDQVTTNPNFTLNPSGPALEIAFGICDDVDSPTATGQATIKRSDEVVDGLESMFVLCADRAASGSHDLGLSYGANSKTWVGGAVSVLKN